MRNKTETIYCEVDGNILSDKRIENYTLARCGATDKVRLKARLIVELPEKRLSLSKSEVETAYNRALKKWDNCTIKDEPRFNFNDYFMELLGF